ncbi:MAG: hypothetical protein M1573_00810 [Candidatus Parvarchaeota archaeon]|jgi:hypothetical protein|nr:hypothetical protein [Candidatus Parvarchaeota archaeon]MCL5017770.1 hypothetical protein [Candidatus Parvarchaeota archaeon]
MKTAGVAFAEGRIIVAVMIDNSIQIHRVKSFSEMKEILDTAAPEIVGVDKSAADMYEDLGFGFNVCKISRSDNISSIKSKISMLSIPRPSDESAIAAAYLASETK